MFSPDWYFCGHEHDLSGAFQLYESAQFPRHLSSHSTTAYISYHHQLWIGVGSDRIIVALYFFIIRICTHIIDVADTVFYVILIPVYSNQSIFLLISIRHMIHDPHRMKVPICIFFTKPTSNSKTTPTHWLINGNKPSTKLRRAKNKSRSMIIEKLPISLD